MSVPKLDDKETVETVPLREQSNVVPKTDTSDAIGAHRLSSMPPGNINLDTDTVKALVHDASQMITAIIGSAEIARLRSRNGEPINELLDIIGHSAIRLKDLLHKFREDVTTGKTGETTAENKRLTPINISEVLRAQIEPRKHLYTHISFNIDIPENFLVLGDVDDIHRILENLFVNARRSLEVAKSASPSISVSILPEIDCAHILMTDNGTGIAPENRKKIFRKGFSTKNEIEHGVGLYYSRKRAKSIGGNLRLYDNSETPASYGGPSEQPGATAVFTLPLPKKSST